MKYGFQKGTKAKEAQEKALQFFQDVAKRPLRQLGNAAQQKPDDSKPKQ